MFKPSKLNQETIDKILELARNGVNASQIQKKLNLTSEDKKENWNLYCLVAYHTRKLKSPTKANVKELVKAETRFIETKTDFLKELTEWIKRQATLYDSIDKFEFSKRLKNVDERKLFLKNNVVTQTGDLFRIMRDMTKEELQQPSPITIPVLTKDIILQVAPLIRKLREENAPTT